MIFDIEITYFIQNVKSLMHSLRKTDENGSKYKPINVISIIGVY